MPRSVAHGPTVRSYSATLKNLAPHIGLTNLATSPNGGGWNVVGPPHRVPGTDTEVGYLHQVYSLGDPDYTGKVTVPTLWDSHDKLVVNNESSEIIRMFNSAFDEIAEPSPDYYPAELHDEIDEMNRLILEGVNNAINDCGRSSGQAAYEKSFELLFGTLDRLEDLLGNQRYLCGDRQTEADWRLFPNLVRFDAIYYIGYKCNRQLLSEYENLSNYLRDLYQTPGIAACCDIEENKRLVYGPGGPIASNGVVPKGPVIDFTCGHNRDPLCRRRLIPDPTAHHRAAHEAIRGRPERGRISCRSDGTDGAFQISVRRGHRHQRWRL